MALSSISDPAARRGGIVFSLLLLLCVASVAAGGYYYYQGSAEEGVRESELILQPVSRGRFDHVVLEQGEIESSSNTEIICEVESRGGAGTAILWVIDEGSRVEKGEKLVELDSSQLETELKQQKIIVSNAQAALSSAEATVKQATIARQEYLQGTYTTEEKAIESEIAVAEQELRKAQLNLRSTERMVAKGLVNSLQMTGDQFGVVNAQSVLEAARGRLKVLQELTREKMLVQFDSDINAAQAAQEAARSTLLEEQEKLADLEQQITACVIYAPSDGVVVHSNRYSSRGGNAEFVVEPGAIVRERQAIIQLPDPSKMQVVAKINESRITLVREGMPARIRVDAAAGMELLGRVKKVNRYAEPGSWFSSSIKEYACAIEIVDPPDDIRTGMTAEVRIFVEQQPDALQMPIQGIYEHFGDTFTLVRTPQGKFETREVDIGATNDSMATIRGGVEDGELVVLNLRSHLDLMNLPTPEESPEELLAAQLENRRSGEAADADGPSDASSRPAASPGAAGAGAASPGAAGAGAAGAGAAGPGGGGPPSAAAMVATTFEKFDTDADGTLSSEEIAAMDERAKRRAEGADSDGDGDGKVSRSELTSATAKFVARLQQQPGGGFSGNDGGGSGAQ
ncbi:efflux RND transporter periplasmic adaptor subunit [Candidatus Laterigemmans baculatus]|uniref:efflux RND transporter periplasmic adaptor subunit n=1 Tax=Candidatus Laterigemmans baculatus TaxID=2770505 RepID=UPI0013DBD39D|nr:efflux RND transporter periplasmic adaptor subunit [Candidatus Laterigemmans baculatus]